MNAPKLRFRAKNGSEYPLWDRVTLGESGSLKSAGVDKKIVPGEQRVRLVNYLDAHRRTFIINSDIEHVVSACEKKVQACNAKRGDIFFTPSSETRDDIARSAVVLEDIDSAVYSYHLMRFRPDDTWDEYFKGYAFEGEPFRRQCYRLADGGGQRYVLSIKNFSRLSISKPSIEEQRRIGGFLYTIDTKIDDLIAKKAALETYKRGLMQKLFSQEIRFTREDGSAYPEWVVQRLANVANCLDNKRKPLNSGERAAIQGSYPYYGANGQVDTVSKYIFDQDIVLLAEDGGNFDEFYHRPIAQKVSGKCWVNNHAHVLSAKPGVFEHTFLFYSLVHKDIRAHVNGSSRAKLNKSHMLSIVLGSPVLEEQRQISNALSAMDVKIYKVSESIGLMQRFKNGLLQKMFV